MLSPFDQILGDWTLPVWLTAWIIVPGCIYLRGWIAIRRTRPAQFTWLRLLSFLSGLTVLWLAIASPMDGLADALLSAHMVEHLLLMSAVPPLLVLGLPMVPMLRGLPSPARRFIAAPLIRSSGLRKAGAWLVTPLVAWVAMNTAFLAWHVPAAYDFALENEHWHDFEHICFLFTSILFWWCVLRPWPSHNMGSRWSILVCLVSADIVNTILSAFLAFCDHPVYRYYLTNPNPFHVAPLDDQILGAVIMWVFGSLVFLVPAVAITVAMVTNDQD